jgi:hypothetical protein
MAPPKYVSRDPHFLGIFESSPNSMELESEPDSEVLAISTDLI